MNTHALLTLLLAGAALVTLDAAEKQKRSDFADYPFWTAKKRGYVAQFIPGLTATLQLTEAQKEQIAAAQTEISNDDAAKAARGISKSDPSVTAEQRDKARATLDAASTRLREKVAAILTPEQKSLIEKVNGAYASAVEETGIVYEDKYGSVKADEAARRRLQEEKNHDIEEQFLHKLDRLLTPAQREAMTRAGEEEMQRKANAVATKKPVK